MKRARNNHIPRFLLGRFASRSEGGKSWVWQFSSGAEHVETSTRDAAVATRFYDQAVENALALAEGKLAAVLGRLERGD
jgi:hypothetical protein